MSVLRGLFVRADATRGTTPVEARNALAAVFPSAGVVDGLVVSGKSGDWHYSVAAGHAVVSRGGTDGVTVLSIDGVTDTPVVAAAPATGSRWDLIWVRHNDVDAGDADSDAVLGVTQGTASGTPTKPYGSVPAGSLVLAEASVAAGATGTLHANVVITSVVLRTGVRGGVISNPSAAQMTALDAIATATNPVWVDDAGLLKRSVGSGWVAPGATLAAAVTFDGIASTGADLWTTGAGGVTLTPGAWLVQAGVSIFNAAVTDEAVCAIRNNTAGTEVPNSRGASGTTRTDGSLTSLVSRLTPITVVSATLVMPMAHPNGGSQLAFRTANMAGGSSAWITALCTS